MVDPAGFITESARSVQIALDTDVRVVGSGRAKLRNFAVTLGLRDTRKIHALYNLTAANVRDEGRFDDSIGMFAVFIDDCGLLSLPTTGRCFQVRYRVLVSQGIRHLLVARRSIGGDKIAHAAVRNMMRYAVSGQGAGVAAAMSPQTGESFDRLNVAAVQRKLIGQGARIH